MIRINKQYGDYPKWKEVVRLKSGKSLLNYLNIEWQHRPDMEMPKMSPDWSDEQRAEAMIAALQKFDHEQKLQEAAA